MALVWRSDGGVVRGAPDPLRVAGAVLATQQRQAGACDLPPASKQGTTEREKERERKRARDPSEGVEAEGDKDREVRDEPVCRRCTALEAAR